MARHLTDRTVWITANKMLYVANLHRDGLLKVGVTDRPRRRRTELRHTLSAPKLSYIIEIDVPWGWGDEIEWGSRLHAALRKNSSRLQLFSTAELTEEVVNASPQDAHRELGKMLLETAVDSSSGAYGLPIDKVDWRFRDFVRHAYPEAEFSPRLWADVKIRQAFLFWLRGEPITRWQRIMQGYSCAEIDEMGPVHPSVPARGLEDSFALLRDDSRKNKSNI